MFLVPWTYLPEDADWQDVLHSYGFKTAAMALRDDSLSIADPRLREVEKLAVVLGTEGDGLASETIAAAVENILYFGAMLAVNLAVMNMLPIPALDGGKIFFLIIDEIAMKLFRKKIPEKYEMAVNTVGFVALMGFMLVVTFNDVFKLFG